MNTTFNTLGKRGTLEANVAGLLKGVSISKADNYALTDAEKLACVSFAFSAASKALTLGLKSGDVMIVQNAGATNAVTVKNLAGDTGTSVGAGKIAIVFASETANGTGISVIN